jgi:2-polyprenyl-3-methyl-5-hydroxy-6-metoxy-1,4-benzoquinol methylase
MSSTDRYYDEHAVEYFQRTVHADMSHLYDRFLSIVPEGGRILDVGCGSGRDLKVFCERGFRVTGIDASPALVEMAKAYSGGPCTIGRMEEIEYEGCFEGIWACASLLHLRKVMLVPILRRLHRALVRGGAMFVSIQEGEGEHLNSDGRFFAFYQPAEFLVAVVSAGFTIEAAWSSEDVLHGRSTTHWLNVLARSDEAGSDTIVQSNVSVKLQIFG